MEEQLKSLVWFIVTMGVSKYNFLEAFVCFASFPSAASSNV
jgi:hypothetical protein